jgi:hypothetical protein
MADAIVWTFTALLLLDVVAGVSTQIYLFTLEIPDWIFTVLYLSFIFGLALAFLLAVALEMDKCNGCGGASEKKDDEAGTNAKEVEGGRCGA